MEGAKKKKKRTEVYEERMVPAKRLHNQHNTKMNVFIRRAYIYPVLELHFIIYFKWFCIGIYKKNVVEELAAFDHQFIVLNKGPNIRDA